MISAVTNPELFATGTTATRSPKKQLDKDAFLQLLVTQLKNQDPSNTMDVYQMSSQLAQFASVEQLNLLNSSMASQSQALQLSMLINQTSFSSSLVGKEVLGSGNQVHVPGSGHAQVHIEVGGTGGTAKLKLMDATGAVVSTRDLGRLSPGAQDVTLPSGLPAGDWHYAIEVTDSAGKAVSVGTTTGGTVTGVAFRNGSIYLQIGNMEVLLDDLLAVGRSAGGSSGSGTTTNPSTGDGPTSPGADQPGDGTPSERQR